MDAYLNSSNEEELEVADRLANGPKVKVTIHASFAVNILLFNT